MTTYLVSHNHTTCIQSNAISEPASCSIVHDVHICPGSGLHKTGKKPRSLCVTEKLHPTLPLTVGLRQGQPAGRCTTDARLLTLALTL